MTVLNPAPGDHATTTLRSDGNKVDLHYLEETRAALPLVIAIIHAVSGRDTGHDVRALARDALAVQTRRLAAVSTCLLAWDRPKTPGPRPAATEALPGLPGLMLDRVFADRLTAHAHASIIAARAELVAGASRGARAIAREAIPAEYRTLAALDLLFPPATRQTVELLGHSSRGIGQRLSRVDGGVRQGM